MKLAIISDDLTGALDSAVVFAARGLRTIVAITGKDFGEALDAGADIVAVSLNTREGKESDAVRKISEAANLVPQGIDVFKKIDSRMKGHVVAETEALARATNIHQVLLCPAIPAMNRFVLDRKVSGAGIAEPIDLVKAIDAAINRDLWAIHDAKTADDLDAIVSAAKFGTMLCGARGLAEALARKLAPFAPADAFQTGHLPHPILFAIGSRDPITLAQVHKLREVAPDMAFEEAPNGIYSGQQVSAGDMIFQSVQGDEDIASAEVTKYFADSVSTIAAFGRATLFLTGGETAAGSLSRLGIGVLEIIGEPLEGVPSSLPLGKSAPVIVTKSGGFGSTDALVQLAGLSTN